MIRAELYVRGSSWLHRADPRAKLALLATGLVLLVLYKSLAAAAAIFVLSLALHGSAGIPGQRIKSTLLALLPVSGLMFLLRSLFYPAGLVLSAWGPIQWTTLGLVNGAVVALRILSMALVVLLWLFTTSSSDIVRGFVMLGLPFSWGLSFTLAIRFLPDFAMSYQIIEQAQRARGLDLASAGVLRRIEKMMPIFIAMLISSLRRSEQMAIALEARAFGSGGVRRTDLHPLHFSIGDGVLAVSTLLLLAAALWSYWALGIGSQPW
ncbi:MAG: energy-coupling factor transporter transmembrane component T [Anaerolineales bacterium]